ncbi:MAG: GumC family protein, partial [Verrucomicrobiales bacterium]
MEPTTNTNQMTRLELVFSIVQRMKIQLKRRWWILLLTASIAVCFQAWMLSNEPINFVSFARIVSSGTVNMNRTAGYIENQRDFFGTQMELMQSGEVRRRALERIEATHPDLELVPVELEVTRTRNSSVVNLQAVGGEPDYTQVYLDSVLDEFINFRREMKEQMTDSTLNQITEELLRLEREMKGGEAELKEFHANNNLVLLEGAENRAAEYLSQLRAEHRSYEKEYELYNLLDLDQNIERRQNLSDGGDSGAREAAAIGLGASERDFIKTKQEIQLLESDLESMAKTYKPSHPRMVQWREELERKKLVLEIYREQSIDTLKKQQQSIGLQIENLASKIEEWEEKALDTSERLSDFQRIATALDRTKSLYENLLKSLRELDLSKSLEQDSLSIMERATGAIELRAQQMGPILSGFGLGLAIGIGILVLVDRLDDRMNSLAE